MMGVPGEGEKKNMNYLKQACDFVKIFANAEQMSLFVVSKVETLLKTLNDFSNSLTKRIRIVVCLRGEPT